MRFFKRLLFYAIKQVLFVLGFISARKRQALYNRLLKFNGLHLNGNPRFIAHSAYFDDFSMIYLGEKVVISGNVTFLTHDYSVTTALLSIGQNMQSDIAFLKTIHVGNNVFIGMNSTLLPGTKIADNVIIGAGSVVRGSLDSNSIYIGNPAVKVKKLSDFANNLDLNCHELRIDKK